MAKADSTVRKLGRPMSRENRDAMVQICFKADKETLRALTVLEKTVGAEVRGRRSVLLRRLILDARKAQR